MKKLSIGLLTLALTTSAMAASSLNCNLYEGEASGNGVTILSIANQGTLTKFQTSTTTQSISGRDVDLSITIDANKIDIRALDSKTRNILGSSFVELDNDKNELPNQIQFTFQVSRKRVGYLSCVR